MIDHWLPRNKSSKNHSHKMDENRIYKWLQVCESVLAQRKSILIVRGSFYLLEAFPFTSSLSYRKTGLIWWTLIACQTFLSQTLSLFHLSFLLWLSLLTCYGSFLWDLIEPLMTKRYTRLVPLVNRLWTVVVERLVP